MVKFELYFMGLHMYLISAEQIRASRAVLKWSYNDLAAKSMVSKSTIVRVENSETLTNFKIETLEKIRIALESTGVIHLPDSRTVIINKKS